MPKAAPVKDIKTEEGIRIEHIERNNSSVPIGYPYRHPERQINLDVSPTIEINFQGDSHGQYNSLFGFGHENKSMRFNRLEEYQGYYTYIYTISLILYSSLETHAIFFVEMS